MTIREVRLNSIVDVLRSLKPGDDEDTVFQRDAAEAHIKELLAARPQEQVPLPTQKDFTLTCLDERSLTRSLTVGMVSPFWTALEKQLAKLLLGKLQASQPPEAPLVCPTCHGEGEGCNDSFHRGLEKGRIEQLGMVSIEHCCNLLAERDKAAFQRGQQSMAEKAGQHRFVGCPDHFSDGKVYCSCGAVLKEDYRTAKPTDNAAWKKHIRSLAGAATTQPKLHISRETLKERIATDPDLPCEAGAATTTSTQPYFEGDGLAANPAAAHESTCGPQNAVASPREEVRARITAIREREQKHLKFAPKAQTSLDMIWLIEQLEAALAATPTQPRTTGRLSNTCHFGEHSHCSGQVKYGNDDNLDDCFPCDCPCHVAATPTLKVQPDGEGGNDGMSKLR